MKFREMPFEKYCFSKKDQDRNIKMWRYINDQLISVVVVLSLSCVWLSAAPLSFTISLSLLKFMPIESAMLDAISLSYLLHRLLLLPSTFPSIRVFSNELAVCMRWLKYWGLIFSISPSNEYTRLISFCIDLLDLLAVQETLKSLLQHKSSKASIVRRSAFFMVQLSYPYMTTGKTIALNIWTLVNKVMSLLFNMLFRFVIDFLPRSTHLLISWLQSPSTVILEPKKRKSASTFFLSICQEVIGTVAMI